jgi:hypothetical protein
MPLSEIEKVESLLTTIVDKFKPLYRQRQGDINDMMQRQLNNTNKDGRKVTMIIADDEYDELEKKIIETGEFNELLQLLTKYNTTVRIFDIEEKIDVKQDLRIIIRNEIMGVPDCFRRKRLISLIYDSSWTILISITLLNLKIPNAIIEIPDQDLNIEINKDNDGYSMLNFALIQTNNNIFVEETIFKIIGILRVYFDPTIKFFYTSHRKNLDNGIQTHHNDSIYLETDVIFTYNNIEDFRKFFFNCYINNKLAAGFRRFAISSERSSPYDRLLDIVYALEFFFGKGEPNSLSFKLATRIARISYSGIEERKRVYKKIIDLYNTRSNIVHGNSLDDDDYYVIANVNNYQQLLQKCIKKLISLMVLNRNSLDEMNTLIDFDIYSGNNIDMGTFVNQNN